MGSCYDQNFCNGNTSPFPIPTCDTKPTTPTANRQVGNNDSGNDGDNEVDVENVVMEGEQGDGSADAIISPGTGS